MKLIKKILSPNGCRVKHLPNRTVAVIQLPRKYFNDVAIEFKKFDTENINEPSAIHLVEKGKVKVTGMVLTKECAAGLYACLHDYFTRIEKI